MGEVDHRLRDHWKDSQSRNATDRDVDAARRVLLARILVAREALPSPQRAPLFVVDGRD
jgi:hypothetical protein